MSSLKIVTIIALSCLLVSTAALAATNKYGVSDVRKFTLEQPMRVGGTLLPVGQYSITHTMEGENHIMVFKQLGTKKPVEAKVKCTLVNLDKKAPQNEKTFIMNAANERVLQTLVFEGDLAKHQF